MRMADSHWYTCWDKLCDAVGQSLTILNFLFLFQELDGVPHRE